MTNSNEKKDPCTPRKSSGCPRVQRGLSTRNAVETAIDLSKMSGTWAQLLGWVRS